MILGFLIQFLNETNKNLTFFEECSDPFQKNNPTTHSALHNGRSGCQYFSSVVAISLFRFSRTCACLTLVSRFSLPLFAPLLPCRVISYQMSVSTN